MLKTKLQFDQIQALKKHQPQTVSILRYILAQIKNKEIDKRSELTDDETVQVLKKIAKELNESIEAFKKGKRDDLVLEYQKQLQVVSSYLPKEISDQDLKKEIEKIIDENKELYEKNPQAIIGVCMKELKSKADPARIMKMLQALETS